RSASAFALGRRPALLGRLLLREQLQRLPLADAAARRQHSQLTRPRRCVPLFPVVDRLGAHADEASEIGGGQAEPRALGLEPLGHEPDLLRPLARRHRAAVRPLPPDKRHLPLERRHLPSQRGNMPPVLRRRLFRRLYLGAHLTAGEARYFLLEQGTDVWHDCPLVLAGWAFG